MSHIQEAARELLQQGFSVLAVGENKKPHNKQTWKEFVQRLPTEEEIKARFNGAPSFALISGKVSGNLELLDIDDLGCEDTLISIIKVKHADILDRMVFTRTPHGAGIVYRCEEPVEGNMRLAKSWEEVDSGEPVNWRGRGKLITPVERDGRWFVSGTKLETRGEGGYFLLHPSPGYEILAGEFNKLQPISKRDRDSILDLARSFDDRPVSERGGGQIPGAGKGLQTVLPHIPYPGEIYDQRTDIAKLLEVYGWTEEGPTTGGGRTFRRPGAPKGRTGGTLYPDGRFHVFSSNADPLQEGKQYSAFSLVTAYDYAGDFSTSTRELAAAGYVPQLTPEELKQILKENPDEIDKAYQNSGLSEADVSAVLVELGIPLPGGRRSPRIQVIYDPLDLSRVTDEVDRAFSSVHGRWGYHWFAGQLGYVTDDNTFRCYDVDTLELRAEDSFYTMSYTPPSGRKGKPKLEAVRVPGHILRKILNYPDSRGPKIKGFAQHPIVTIEGRILGLQDGFEGGIMFKNCDRRWTVDDRSFKECYDRIVELFCGDILFKDKERGRALFVSMMMTALVRLAIDGGCPGYFITANEPGTGKSTMFEFVSRIVYGRLMESVDWGTDTVERRKEIIAYLREGQECFLFDNIQQGEEVKSPILAQALSAGEFKARVMGKGEMVYVPAQSLFVFVGNGLNMSTELSRRLMTIELLTRGANPARRNVKVANIAEYCEQHRDEVIGCLLKMITEGLKMDSEIKRSSGFGFWDKIVRNPILVEVGQDLTEGFDASADASEETSSVEELIQNLTRVFGVGPENTFTTKDVFLAIADERVLDAVEMAEAIQIRDKIEAECRELRDTMKIINAQASTILKSTGRVLSNMADRVVGEYQFVRYKTKSNKPVKHWIEYAGKGGGDDE